MHGLNRMAVPDKVPDHTLNSFGSVTLKSDEKRVDRYRPPPYLFSPILTVFCGFYFDPRYSAFEARKSDRHASGDGRRGESADTLARTVRELDRVRAENKELKERVASNRTDRACDKASVPSVHRRGSSGGLEDGGSDEGQVSRTRAVRGASLSLRISH